MLLLRFLGLISPFSNGASYNPLSCLFKISQISDSSLGAGASHKNSHSGQTPALAPQPGKNHVAFSKIPSFLGGLITSQNGLKPWTQEFLFLKFPCESGLMDVSTKCKSCPLLAHNEIQSFMLNIQKINVMFFGGTNHLQKRLASNQWAQIFKYLKFPSESYLIDFSMKCKSFPLLHSSNPPVFNWGGEDLSQNWNKRGV